MLDFYMFFLYSPFGSNASFTVATCVMLKLRPFNNGSKLCSWCYNFAWGPGYTYIYKYILIISWDYFHIYFFDTKSFLFIFFGINLSFFCAAPWRHFNTHKPAIGKKVLEGLNAAFSIFYEKLRQNYMTSMYMFFRCGATIKKRWFY